MKSTPITVADAGRIGGKNRMASMTAEERSAFARLGGLAGGPARAKRLPAKRRREIAALGGNTAKPNRPKTYRKRNGK